MLEVVSAHLQLVATCDAYNPFIAALFQYLWHAATACQDEDVVALFLGKAGGLVDYAVW
jgi:hypothetical protein